MSALPSLVLCLHGRVLPPVLCSGCEEMRATPHRAQPVAVPTGRRGRPPIYCRACGLSPSRSVHRSAR